MALTKVGKEGITGVSNASDATAITIDSSEKVGIGLTSPQELLHIKDGDIVVGNGTASNNAVIGKIGFSTDSSNSRFIGIESFRGSDAANADLRFHTYGGDSDKGERMRITTAGNVGIGTTSPSAKLHVVQGDAALLFTNTFTNVGHTACHFSNSEGSGAYRIRFDSNDTVVGSIGVGTSSTAYNTSSDYRLKENVVYDWDATTRLKQLKPARFNFIIDADKTVDGFLAHEAQAIVPESVTGTKDEVDEDGVAVMQSIDNSKLVPLLVKTIQELEARLTAGGAYKMPYIGRGSDFGVRSRFIYTATAGQTTFSGNDDAGITLAYTDTLYMDVYQNGVLLVPATDYAASTGTSVVLVQGASVDDTLELLVHDIFSVADSVSAKDGGSFSGNVGMGGTLAVTGAVTLSTKLATTNLATGAVVQVVNTTSVAVATGTTTIPLDDTIPQNNEGTEFLTLAITPTNASNKLKIEVSGLWGTSADTNWVILALFQDSTANALSAQINFINTADRAVGSELTHFMTAGTTSETTFKLRVGPNASATITMNGGGGARLLGGAMSSSITITEIAV